MIPPRRILAAVDFSEPSRTALTLAARLAVQAGADLHVVYVEDPLLCAAAQARGLDVLAEARAELTAFIESTLAEATPPTYHVRCGHATDAICDIGHRERAELIVLGMHGMSGAERVMFGSTTEGVLRRADVSVLVVPAGWTPPHLDRQDLTGVGPVVAAVDFSEPSITAAAAACRLAGLLHTSVELVHVVPASQTLARWRADADVAVTDRMAAARRELRGVLPALGSAVPVELVVDTGHLPEQLVALAAPGANRHPLLVLGRRSHVDRGGAPGSTAYRVLTMAAVPVMVHLLREQ